MKKVTENDIEIFKDSLVIYRIYNIESKKSYIGKSSKGMNRVLDHLKCWHNPNQDYRAKLLYRAMRKYGQEKFDWEILGVYSNIEDLNRAEKETIIIFDSIKNGYNIGRGGTGGDTWSNLSEVDLKKANEKRLKSRKKFLNSKAGLEYRKKLSETLRSIRKDPEKSKKNREISSQRLKRLNKEDPRFQAKRSKKVICLETNITYNSITAAAKEIGTSQSTLSKAIIYNNKCKGYTFKKI